VQSKPASRAASSNHGGSSAKSHRAPEIITLTLALRFIKRLLVNVRVAGLKHPRRLAAGVLGLLGTYAIGAFGIAPLAPDAALLPQRLITEALQIPGIDRQLGDLAEQTLELNHSDLTRGSDTADSLLRRLGVNDPVAATFVRNDPEARRLIDGRGGKMVQVRTAADGTLLDLIGRFPALDATRNDSQFTRLKLSRVNGQFTSTLETAALVPQVRLGSGKVNTSLWAAADEARLPDAIASQLIEIFSGDIDFHRQLRKGDIFSVVYETMTADDQPISWNDGTRRIVAAEFVNNGKALQALWFQDGGNGKGGYFGRDGRSRHKAFLASPVAFSRITSGFAMRFHPILQNWRAHNGVDYAAPTGTEVRSVGDGVVESAGRQNGYGNVIQVMHGKGQSTLYAHLSRIDVRQGQRVEQGQRIGAVGATGWATGPHLHFEFRINGQFQDPLQVVLASDNLLIDSTQQAHFQEVVASVQHQLTMAESLSEFRSDAE
jgi:murein DD-endopeptidase MepM/ murein hydrolase activator NlpD